MCIYLKWKSTAAWSAKHRLRDHSILGMGQNTVSARGGGRRFDDPAEIEEKHELAEIRITCGVYSFRAGWISKGAGPDSAVHGVPDSGDRTGDLDESVCDGCANERTELPQYVEKKCLEHLKTMNFCRENRMCRRNG